MEIIAEDQVMNQVTTIKGEERIYVTIDREYCKRLQYIFYKRQGLENLFLSYMNNTFEDANKMNFDTFVDRLALTYVEESQNIEEIGILVLGKELYDYLSHSQSEQMFTIDYTHNQLIIHHRSIRNSVIPHLGGCNCSIK